jgi:hypothetical protein
MRTRGSIGSEPESKSELLKDTFFSTPPEADLQDTRRIVYDNQIELTPPPVKPFRWGLAQPGEQSRPGTAGESSFWVCSSSARGGPISRCG